MFSSHTWKTLIFPLPFFGMQVSSQFIIGLYLECLTLNTADWVPDLSFIRDHNWILAWDSDRISNNSWNYPKHMSIILYFVPIQSSILNSDSYKVKRLTNFKMTQKYSVLGWLSIFRPNVILYVKISKSNNFVSIQNCFHL